MGLSAREVQDRKFSTSMRGYDRTEVGEYLSQVADHQAQLEERLAIAEAKASKAQANYDRMNDVLETKLAETHEARTTILAEARKEAETIIATSQQVSEPGGDASAVHAGAAIIAEAETKAELRMKQIESLHEQARHEAEETARQAEQSAELKLAEADRVIEAARKDARDIRRAAEADRSEMEVQLAHLRSIVAAAVASEGKDLADANIEFRDNGSLVVDLTAPATQEEVST
ncbi:MAG: DivIVA domain-containing protein [Acidimicrobiia bacterium]